MKNCCAKELKYKKTGISKIHKILQHNTNKDNTVKDSLISQNITLEEGKKSLRDPSGGLNERSNENSLENTTIQNKNLNKD